MQDKTSLAIKLGQYTAGLIVANFEEKTSGRNLDERINLIIDLAHLGSISLMTKTPECLEKEYQRYLSAINNRVVQQEMVRGTELEAASSAQINKLIRLVMLAGLLVYAKKAGYLFSKVQIDKISCLQQQLELTTIPMSSKSIAYHFLWVLINLSLASFFSVMMMKNIPFVTQASIEKPCHTCVEQLNSHLNITFTVDIYQSIFALIAIPIFGVTIFAVYGAIQEVFLTLRTLSKLTIQIGKELSHFLDLDKLKEQCQPPPAPVEPESRVLKVRMITVAPMPRSAP